MAVEQYTGPNPRENDDTRYEARLHLVIKASKTIETSNRRADNDIDAIIRLVEDALTNSGLTDVAEITETFLDRA